MIEITVQDKTIYPSQVRDLLKALSAVGFFDDSMLIGSWVMPLYKDSFGISYALRTMDIDFGVRLLSVGKNTKTIDVEQVITDLGFIPVVMQSGVRRFTRENFSVEFVAQRRGGRTSDFVTVRQWNITASPLPFVDILLDFPFSASFGNFTVTAPLPEAFFVYKLITSQRRPDESKKYKDLEQCAAIARQINAGRLKQVIQSLGIGKKTQKALRASCQEIGFPPQMVGLQ